MTQFFLWVIGISYGLQGCVYLYMGELAKAVMVIAYAVASFALLGVK